ncbi:MAG: 4'-phosphopantetheinyl transferase superfamily protein [Lachnospiraceae bacterium]|nr:4'-phosphopantetheinyl transferase superfamily protein [Lachnospiraceae bacterium]
MIKTYLMDVRQLENEKVYEKAISFVSPYRRQKIALLKHQKDKNRSLGAALALHRALMEYGLEERMMEYDNGEQGKPFFRYYPEIFFSLSHSGDYAICSVGEAEIGNDIEKVKNGRLRVAERFFAEEENKWIMQAETEDEMEERMFRLWTMKESFLKVTGLGMSLVLKDFTVSIRENNEVSIGQHINEKKYFLKEYPMPTDVAVNEPYKSAVDEPYKIAVCSVCDDFSPEIIPVLAQDILHIFE